MSTLAMGLLPVWIALPAAAAVMFTVAGHVLMIQRAQMPGSRRRIRTCAGLVMLVVTPLLAHALSTGPGVDQPRPMALVWMTIIALLGLVIGLALLDVLNTLRLHMLHMRGLRRETRARVALDLAGAARARVGESPLPPSTGQEEKRA